MLHEIAQGGGWDMEIWKYFSGVVVVSVLSFSFNLTAEKVS